MTRNFLLSMLLLWLISALTACSRSPRVNFYTLESGVITESAANSTNNQGVIIGPVTLPDLVDRPQIVLRVAANQVEILEEQRWAEPLKSGIPRFIADDLGGMIGSDRVYSYLQNSSADSDCRVVLDITRFEAVRGEGVTVEAVWSLRRGPGRAVITGYFQQHEPVKAGGYDSVVAAYGRALHVLSCDLLKVLRAEAVVSQ